VQGWGPSGTTQRVNVACFSPQGAPRDGNFTMAFSQFSPNMTPAFEYAWVDDPFSATSTPFSTYQKGGIPGDLSAADLPPTNPITVTRYGVGNYAVRFPNMLTNQAKSNVNVTAYGGGSEVCKVGGWGSEFASVQCFNAWGAPADSRYTIVFSSDLIVIH
jgi:hypothetical protein